MSRYLIEERPLTVLPSLVAIFGFEKAVIIQQIHWLCNQPNSGRVLDDGKVWVWGSHPEWCERYFTFWRPDTLRKHLTALEKLGVVLSCQPNTKNWDRRKHYRVDHAALDAYIAKNVENIPFPSNRHDDAASKRDDDAASKRHDDAASEWHDDAASNTDDDAGSYIEQNRLTEPTTKTTTKPEKKESSSSEKKVLEKNSSDVERLLRNKLSRRGGDPDAPYVLDECLEENPNRAVWLLQSFADLQRRIQIADRRYRSEKAKAPTNQPVYFKTELINLLDDELTPQTPNPRLPPEPDPEPPAEKPKTEAERLERKARGDQLLREARERAKAEKRAG